MSLFSIELLAEYFEVHNRCLDRNKLGLWELSANIFLLLVSLCILLIHDCLNAIEQLSVLIILVALNVPVEAFLLLYCGAGFLCSTSVSVLLYLLLLFLLILREIYLNVIVFSCLQLSS